MRERKRLSRRRDVVAFDHSTSHGTLLQMSECAMHIKDNQLLMHGLRRNNANATQRRRQRMRTTSHAGSPSRSAPEAPLVVVNAQSMEDTRTPRPDAAGPAGPVVHNHIHIDNIERETARGGRNCGEGGGCWSDRGPGWGAGGGIMPPPPAIRTTLGRRVLRWTSSLGAVWWSSPWFPRMRRPRVVRATSSAMRPWMRSCRRSLSSCFYMPTVLNGVNPRDLGVFGDEFLQCVCALIPN